MARKEIVFLTGQQILIAMIVISNALIIGFVWRYHSYQAFKQEKQDLAIFSEAQRSERKVKEDIRILEGAKTWLETDYAKNNAWSVLPDEK